jgi:acyl-CoA dehydrogenase
MNSTAEIMNSTADRIAPAGPEARAKTAGAAAAAAAVAAQHAGAVDQEARFPHEAMGELRRQGLLGIFVPPELGGEGASLGALADVCYALGQACASTGLIYAMHQVKMGCLVRHRKSSPAIEAVLRKIVAGQLLLASSTTEGQAGGNVRSSEAPVVRDGDRLSLERKATVISYGAAADGVVTTARRSPSAPASDQVLLVFLKPECTLEPMPDRNWNTLGMRGTCSEGFTLRAQGSDANLVPEPYERIHAQTMVPFAHLLWGSVWAGIAAAATARAQLFVRQAFKSSNGQQLPPAAGCLTKAVARLHDLRGLLASGLRSYEQAMGDERSLTSLEFQSMITLMKVQVSELACETVLEAMRTGGLAGYRNDGDFSIGRHLRDVLSAPIMINNDRIRANLATNLLVTALPSSITG